MSLQNFSQTEILDAVDLLMEQSAQTFSFQAVEEIMRETRATELGAILGICTDLVNRFRAEGLTVDEADKVACRLGEHPSLIWVEWSNIEVVSESLYDEVEEFLHANKLCGKCKLWNPREEFHKRSASKDGVARYCRSCMKSYERSRKKKQ